MPGTTPTKEITPPDDFASAEEYLKWVREQREQDLDYDRVNRVRGQEDCEFAAGYQWSEEDKARRQSQGVPTLTFNRSFTLLRQKLAARAKLRVGPRILPESSGKDYEAIASIREGLIRNIERISDCGTVDTIVSQNQFIAGVGAYEIAVDYANEDVFEYDVFIRPIHNPFSVSWDRLSIDPTGRDARHAMLESLLDIDDFRRTYPNALASSIDGAGESIWSNSLRSKSYAGNWLTDKTVRVATVWRMRERPRTLALMDNGAVVELPEGQDPTKYAIKDGEGGFSQVVRHPETQEPVVRLSPVRYAEGVITNGFEILKGPFILPIDRVPYVRVPGWTIMLGDRVERFGLVSFAKDAMRFHNYLRSDRAERIVFRPRFAWIANEEEIQGREALWANSHLNRNAIGVHKGPPGGGPKPVEPPVADQASILEAEAAVQDIMDIFDVTSGGPGTGLTPPTASSLEMLQSMSEASNVVFDELYFAGKRECYRIINQLISLVYDTPRIVKVMGQDDQLKTAILNDPNNPESVDVTIGKYSVSVDVGPSLMTRRAHAIEFLKTMINSAPDAAAIIFDKLIELQNIQGGDVLARRWRERFGLSDEEDDSPEAQAAAQQEAQLKQMELEHQLKMAQAEIDLKLAEIQVKQADAEAKRAIVLSELAQAEERRAAAAASVDVSMARVEELMTKVELIKAQIGKTTVEAEIAEMQADEPAGDKGE